MNKTLQESFNRFLFLFGEAERIRRANITSSTKQLYWFSANQRRYAWRGNQRVETWCCRTNYKSQPFSSCIVLVDVVTEFWFSKFWNVEFVWNYFPFVDTNYGLPQLKFKRRRILEWSQHSYYLGSGYFAVDGNLPLESILP